MEDTMTVFEQLQLEAGFQGGINNDNMQRYSESIVKLCIQICLKGNKTQTTCFGAAEAIREHFK
jgi:hypothetical protein